MFYNNMARYSRPEYRARCSGFEGLQISGLEFRAELRGTSDFRLGV